MTLAIRGSEPKYYNLIRATVCCEQGLSGYRESEDSGRFPEVYDLVISCILSRNGQSQPVFSLGLIRSEAACIYKGTMNLKYRDRFNETHGANGFPLLIKQITWFTDRDHTKYFLRTSVFQWFFRIVPSNCFIFFSIFEGPRVCPELV